ncbi:MAG: substrate-binding domain-containing protein [Opitutaceae bacterium]|nr:substrate-binding domain-containing protein [Opitutaceae bacterium]
MKKLTPYSLPLILFCTVGLPAAPSSETAKEEVALRDNHFTRIKERGQKSYYTRKFDLSGLPEYRPEPVSGTVRFCGADYFIWVSRLSKYWEEGFRRHQPNVKLEYLKSNQTEPLLYGLADVASWPRPLDWGERQQFQDKLGYAPLEIQYATGSYNVPGWTPALAIYVHRDNPITRISVDELSRIFGAQRRGGWEGTRWRSNLARGPESNIRTWGQLGLTGVWQDRPINVYGRPIVYGMNRQVERKIFKGGGMWNETLREYAHDFEPGTAKTQIVSAVAMLADLSKDPNGIAYNNLDATRPPPPATIKLIAVAEKAGGPYVDLTMETVQNRTYPLFLELYFIMKREPGRPLAPAIREYLRYALSREGQEAVERDGKWLPLTAEVARRELAKLE